MRLGIKKNKMLRKCIWLSALFSVAFLAMSLPAQAQSLEPRLYNNIPTGLNFLLVGYGYSQGAVLVDPSLPLEDLNARIHLPVVAFLRSFSLWGKSSKIDVVVPYAWFSGSGRFIGDEELTYREVSGFADPSFRFTINLYGAPALSLKEFIQYRQKTVVGVSFQVTAPFGKYDPSKLGNIGTNRWTFKPGIGISRTLRRWIFEVSTSMNFYTTNNDFWGGKIRKQDPILAIQGHAIYTFQSGLWLSLNATYYTGGQTTIDGKLNNDLQTNWRFGGTMAFPINRRNSIKIYGSTGVYTRTGTNFNLIGIAWQYRWGGSI